MTVFTYAKEKEANKLQLKSVRIHITNDYVDKADNKRIYKWKNVPEYYDPFNHNIIREEVK